VYFINEIDLTETNDQPLKINPTVIAIDDLADILDTFLKQRAGGRYQLKLVFEEEEVEDNLSPEPKPRLSTPRRGRHIKVKAEPKFGLGAVDKRDFRQPTFVDLDVNVKQEAGAFERIKPFNPAAPQIYININDDELLPKLDDLFKPPPPPPPPPPPTPAPSPPARLLARPLAHPLPHKESSPLSEPPKDEGNKRKKRRVAIGPSDRELRSRIR